MPNVLELPFSGHKLPLKEKLLEFVPPKGAEGALYR